jgi:hypothetical protein
MLHSVAIAGRTRSVMGGGEARVHVGAELGHHVGEDPLHARRQEERLLREVLEQRPLRHARRRRHRLRARPAVPLPRERARRRRHDLPARRHAPRLLRRHGQYDDHHYQNRSEQSLSF